MPEHVELGEQCFAIMQMPSENFLISCGNWENSFQVISLSDGRMVQSIRQHKDVVSCVAGTFDKHEYTFDVLECTVLIVEEGHTTLISVFFCDLACSIKRYEYFFI